MKKALLVMTMVLSAAVLAEPKEAANASAAKGSAKSAQGQAASAKKGKKAKMSLTDARNLIGKIVEGVKGYSIGKVIVQLSEEDQKTFLAEVNKAISELPASIEEKTAKYLNLNHEALKSVAQSGNGNLPALLAETFATVAPESLTVLNERFAIDLMNRSANPKITYTDEQYTKIAVDLMKVINERTAETDNGSSRSAFAMLMLIRASNGTPADLADKLIDTLEHDDAKELARKEWIPSALGKDGREQGYEPLLASADAGRRPDFAKVIVIAGPQFLDSILSDVSGKNTDEMAFIQTRSPILDAVENPLVHQIPNFDGDAQSEVAPNDPLAPYAGQKMH